MYISDKEKLSNAMGQFELWCGKLFYYHSNELGWEFIKDIAE